ncbi:MAG: hypothetical protein ACPIOQ_59380 [Promethearchaeia archaeon]
MGTCGEGGEQQSSRLCGKLAVIDSSDSPWTIIIHLAFAIPTMRELSEAAAALVAGFLGGYYVAGGSSSVGVTCALIALVYRARVYIQVCARANPHPKERDPLPGVCA